MSTFEKQFGHLKETDPIAYYDLKGNHYSTDLNTTKFVVLLITIVCLGICGLIILLT